MSDDQQSTGSLQKFANLFPKVLFVSEKDMNEYCANLSIDAAKEALALQEGEEISEINPKEHLYILKQLVGRNHKTAAFVALRGSNLSEQVIAKFVVLDGEKQATYARSELHCLAACHHFGIVKHYDDFIADDKLLLIMEYGSGGDLNIQIKERRNQKLPFEEHEVGLLFYQIVLALDDIHNRRMMHRDLKSANVFLMSSGIIKLGDFGFSKQYSDSVSLDVGTSFCGTPYYLAPELWERRRYSKKADMWSLGVILYELLTLQKPFKGPSQREIMQQVVRGHYDPFMSNVSRSMKSLVDPLLSKDPADRPTTAQLLNTEYLKYVANLFEEVVKSSSVIKDEDKKEILQQLKDSRRRAPPPPSVSYGVTNVSHEGYLLKYCSDSKWKKRYFVVKNGSLQISLTDNPSADKVEPKIASLEAISDVFPAPEVYCRSHPNQLVIWFTNGQKIIALAKTEEERDMWISKLHRACGM